MRKIIILSKMGIIITSKEEIAIPLNFDIIKMKFRKWLKMISLIHRRNYGEKKSLDFYRWTMFDTEPAIYHFCEYQPFATIWIRHDLTNARCDDLRIKPLCRSCWTDHPYEKSSRKSGGADGILQKSWHSFKPGLNQILSMLERRIDLRRRLLVSAGDDQYLLERNGLASFSVVQSGKAPHESRRRMSSSWPAKSWRPAWNGPGHGRLEAEFWPLIEPDSFHLIPDLKLIKRCRPWPVHICQNLRSTGTSWKIRPGTEGFQSRTASVKCCRRQRRFQGSSVVEGNIWFSFK